MAKPSLLEALACWSPRSSSGQRGSACAARICFCASSIFGARRAQQETAMRIARCKAARLARSGNDSQGGRRPYGCSDPVNQAA
eukprot:1465589-Alexandrium_andersonii.AAC.1